MSTGELVSPPMSVTTAAEARNLIQRAQVGEPEAITELYRQHAPKIFRYFYFRLKHQATAEDLTSEVFLKMVQGLPTYTDRGAPITAWLFRIAHARLVDYYRRHQQTPETLSEQHLDPQASPETQTHERLTWQTLQQHLTALTEEQQLVLQLRFAEGFNVEDTARILRKSVGAVKALQHRALTRLAEMLDDEF